MAGRKMHGARYSTIAILLHWAIAGLILAQIPLGWQMGIDRSAKSFALFQLHKSIGFTILILTLIRIAWRLVHRPPPLTVHGWEAALARFIHGLFYFLLLALPLTGWLMVSLSPTGIGTLIFGTVPWPDVPVVGTLSKAAKEAIDDVAGEAHEIMAYLVLAALFLHVLGALKHQWIDRDNNIGRMAPFVKGAFSPALLLILAFAVGSFAFGRFFVPPLPHAETAPAADEATGNEAAAAPAPPRPAAGAPEASPIDNAVDAVIAEDKAAADEGKLAKWVVQKGGKLGFTTQWSGNTLEGRFKQWDADISFGTAALDQSRVTARIETASATTGQGQPDDALPGDDFFAASAFPTATFNASRFRKTTTGYQATGTLMIKGKTKPVTLDFTLDIQGDTAHMKGSAPISRLDYGIGYDDTSDIPAVVTVNIDLVAKRQK